MAKVESPFLIVNPKSYLYGEKSLELAKAADKTAKETGLQIYFTCPICRYQTDQRKYRKPDCMCTVYGFINSRTWNGICTSRIFKRSRSGSCILKPCRKPETVSELYATIKRAKELGMITIVCADSTVEAKAVACMDPDIVLAEPTD